MLAAQTPSKPAKNPAKRPTPADLELQRQREHAYETVKTVWAEAKNIADTRQRADIVTRAFSLMWTREPDFARAELTRNFTDWLNAYTALTPEDKKRNNLEAALNKLIRVLARKDSAVSRKLLEQFFAARQKALGNKAAAEEDLADSLGLASELLEVDLAQSVQLASRVLESSVNREALQYLFDLQAKKPELALALYRRALALLAGGQQYGPDAAVFLSAFAFNEKEFALPLWNGEGKQRTCCGIWFAQFNLARSGADTQLAAEYVGAAYQFLQARVFQPTGADRANPLALSTNYFLLRKLKAYARFFQLDPEARWAQYESATTTLALEAGLTADNLAWLAQKGEMVIANRPIGVPDDSEGDFARAQEEKDPEKKGALLTRAILALARQKRFSEALQSLDQLETLAARNQLAQLIYCYQARDIVLTRRWDELATVLAKIEYRNVKIYFWLEAARVLVEAKSGREVALVYLSEARKALETLDDGNEKAAGVVVATTLLYQLDPTLAPFALNDAPNVLNNAQKYDGGVYFVTLTAPYGAGLFGIPLTEIGFADCFTQAGKYDWTGADLAARSIRDKYLQAWARLMATQSFLQVK